MPSNPAAPKPPRVILEAGKAKLKVCGYPSIDSIVGTAGRLNRALSWQQARTVARSDRLKRKVIRRD